MPVGAAKRECAAGLRQGTAHVSDGRPEPPRIAVDALAARFGGTAYAAVQVARHLGRDPAVGEVAVVTRRGSIVADGLHGAPGVRLVLLRKAHRAELARRLAWEAACLPGLEATAWLTWSGMLPRSVHGHLVCHLNNPVVFAAPRRVDRLRREAIVRTARRASEVIVPSAAMAALVEPVIGRRPIVVAHGIDHRRFAPAHTPGDEVLCVADGYRHKRLEVVVGAWAALPKPRPTLRLVGNPDVEPGTAAVLRATIKLHRFVGRIEVERDLTLSELVETYHRARVFVLASEQESFCMPLLEALACGVPAVVRDTAALRETGGPGAAFVASSDVTAWAAAIERFLGDDALHAGARTAGIEHASAYDWKRTAAGVRDALVGSAA
jgi:glycosyltransferase involved in cell wall biosynthesis